MIGQAFTPLVLQRRNASRSRPREVEREDLSPRRCVRMWIAALIVFEILMIVILVAETAHTFRHL